MFNRVARQALAAITILTLGALATGCGRSEGPRGKGGRPRIALIMKSLANEFFTTMENGAKAHQQAHADQFELLPNGIKDESDLNQQVTLVDQMIALRVDAIVIAPADSKALVAACRRAQKAGIVVVNIDNRLDAGVLAEAGIKVPFVGPDNCEGARKVGDFLAKHLKPGDEVAILEGIPTAFNAQQRRRGFEEAMNAAGMKIVGVQSGQWETDKAKTVAAAMLGEHPNLKALLCSNDSMALGALAAVKQAGKAGQVEVVGFDNISAVAERIKDGSVLATADQHADQLAVYGIEFALKVLSDETAPDDKETPVDLITSDKAK